ncbi:MULTISPECIES: hypothetical protein [Candidatus Cardinium]|uniref:hypothetical protein n=1 Tax=Candidatus Cardinium TaxID=273135 RepID=UPI001FAACFEB|nr:MULTISPECIES: hypothetical protein [Cardinium]
MKSNMKAVARFLAVILALLAIGMHGGVVVIPILSGYKFSMLFIAFLFLFVSIIL